MVVLPSSPVWYQSRGASTSHNGILAFGSRNLVFLLDLNKKRTEIYGILSGHTDKVTTCSFCPVVSRDGQVLRLASGADDCSIKVWDVKQKLMLHEHTAHGQNKIISVHWSPVNSSLIVSGDEKGFVICWDLDKGSTDRFYPDGSSQIHICSLTCSAHNENLVAIGYKSGAVSLIDIKRNGMVIKKMRGHASEVHGIVWSPYQDESLVFSSKYLNDDVDDKDNLCKGVIATGSKDKTIKLWSVSEGKCLRTLRIPNRVTKGRKVNEDVARLYASVYWPENSKTKFISAGYNGDIVTWDVDPKAENLFEILASQTHDTGHHRIVFNITQGANPANSIVSTSMDRQILHWTIPSDSVSNCPGPDWSLPTLGGFVYSISVSPKDPSLVAIGVGDGMIRVWKTRSPKSAYDIVTLWQGIKEKVMTLSWHPNKEGHLAFATEDGKVGIYDTLSMRPPIIAETYHLKPVYALSWGPKCFQKLPEDGKLSAPNNTKNLHLYSCGGDGVILQHDPQNMSGDALNIDNIISTSNSNQIRGKHSEVSWNQNGKLLAIGNDNGAVIILLAPHLVHIMEIKCHSKIVNCVRWKPHLTESDESCEIATGSNNSIIFIHDIKKILLENNYTIGEEIEQPIRVSKPHRSLIGHLSRITGLSYNPRNPSEILSSCYDTTAQVWNTESEKMLYNFRGHHGRLMCAAWTSVIDEMNSEKTSGIIYTGADDYTVHGWYAEDQQHTEPVKVLPDFGFGMKNKFQGKKKGRQKKSPQTQQPKINGPSSDAVPNGSSTDLDFLLDKKKAELLASMNGDTTTSENDINKSLSPATKKTTSASTISSSQQNEIRNLASVTDTPTGHLPYLSPRFDGILKKNSTTPVPDDDLFGRRRKRLKNMFPQSVTMDNRKKSEQHQDCVKIMKWKTKSEEEKLSFIPGSNDHINLGFYTDRPAAFRMMKNEGDKLQGDDISEGNYNLKVWMGDIVGTIKDATERSQLTDQLVAMAPIAGQAFWRKTAHDFAKQLIAEDHQLHAVHYLLVCDKVHEAIQVLLDSRHYREAVALARARLCDDDPILKRTISTWGRKLKIGGSVELAAKCFASIGDFHEAASSLAQRATSGASTITDSDVSSLWAATSIAKIAGDYDAASGYGNRALNTVCLRTWNWLENNEILDAFDNLHEYRFISIVHEIITSKLLEANFKELPTMKKSTWNNTDFYCEERISFPELVIKAWRLQNGMADTSTLLDLDAKSAAFLHKEAGQHMLDNVTESRIILEVAVMLSAAICTTSNVSDDENQKQPRELSKETSTQECFSKETNWNDYLINALNLLIGVQTINQNTKKKILTQIFEVVSWTDEFKLFTEAKNSQQNANDNLELSGTDNECGLVVERGVVYLLNTCDGDIKRDLSSFLNDIFNMSEF